MSNLDFYKKPSKKKKPKALFTNMQANIDAFNHVLSGTGDMPGLGGAVGMAESIEAEDNILDAILQNFKTTDSCTQRGACYILPDGKFLWVDRAHGEVDEFVIENFDVDILQFRNSYLVDKYNCIRLNDGLGSFAFDRYITLPNNITSNQIYSIEEWLENYPAFDITVTNTKDNKMFEFDLRDGVSRLISRIKKYKSTGILTEDSNDLDRGKYMSEKLDSLEDSEKIESEKSLPDVSEDNIIEDEDAGISSLFIDAINSCWNAIDDYHSIIVTLDSLDRHEFDETLQMLLEERNKEVGALQGVLELLSPASSQIEQGKEEAQDQLSFDTVEENLCLESNHSNHRKTYSELTEAVKLFLKEDWNSNGTLEDFSPESLVQKAFDNKYSTNSVREFKNKLLYINVDPGFIFGQRLESDKIWINIVEIDKGTNDQERIYLDSASDEDTAIQMLTHWKEEYMNGEEFISEPVEDQEDVTSDGDVNISDIKEEE